MTSRRNLFGGRTALLLVMAGLCGSAMAQQFQVVNRTLVSTKRETQTLFDYTYRVDALNKGLPASQVTAAVTSSSTDTAVLQGALAFGDMAAGAVVSSVDTLTIRQNRLVPFDPGVLTFQFHTADIPVANAGPNQTVMAGSTVQLDGSASFDALGRPLTFAWTLLPPPGSTGTISDSTNRLPTFVADIAGIYRAELIVNNGMFPSAKAQVMITAIPLAGGVRCGDLISGKITAAAQVDTLKFQGRAGRTVTLTLADTSGFVFGVVAVATLFAPTGEALVSFNANGQQQVALKADGVYVIQVRASDFATTGNYSLGLQCRNPADIAVTIGCGALPSGALKAAQVDQYTFQGQANRIVTLTLADTSGFVFGVVAVATLFAPTGEPLVSFNANGQQQVALKADGTYLIQVRASDFASTGAYSLGLQCRNPADIAGAIGCGALPSGTIKAAQVDQYTFQGQTGRTVTLTLADTSGFVFGVVAVATLFAPTGEPLVSFNANSQQQVALKADGVYLIQVRASDFATTGNYSLGLQCRNPADIAGAIGCGALPSGALKAAQVDQYTFQGQTGRTVTLTLADTSGFVFGVVAVATLFAPTGEPLVSFNANSQQQVALKADGVYLIQVRASDFATTGNYSLGLQCRNPADIAGAIGCGALPSGALKAAQVDQYTFQGQTGRTVTLTLADTSGFVFGVVAVATLFAPTGEPLVSFNANSQQQVALKADGVYLIQVRASDFATTGNYSLGLQCRNPADIAGAIGCGALSSGALKAAEVDQYTFQGQANRIVTLTLADTSGFVFGVVAVATLFAPTGEALVSFNANGQQQLALKADGTYLIQVRASDFATTGVYSLGLQCP